jgi:hypothetical protein
MTASRLGLMLVFIAAAALAFFIGRWTVPPKVISETSPISVPSFTQLPVGYLGVPLGTVVHATGVTISGDELRVKMAQGKTFLRVETVNGKSLAEPVDFEFLRADKNVPTPIIGERFHYQVHEYGSFDGHVDSRDDFGDIEDIFAHDGFYYRRSLTVHKALAK